MVSTHVYVPRLFSYLFSVTLRSFISTEITTCVTGMWDRAFVLINTSPHIIALKLKSWANFEHKLGKNLKNRVIHLNERTKKGKVSGNLEVLNLQNFLARRQPLIRPIDSPSLKLGNRLSAPPKKMWPVRLSPYSYTYALSRCKNRRSLTLVRPYENLMVSLRLSIVRSYITMYSQI